MKSVRDQVDCEPWKRVWKQIKQRVSVRIQDQVWNEIWDGVVDYEFGGHVKIQVEDQP